MARRDPIEGETVATRDAAEKLSRMLGCQGSHKQGDAWGPCESQEALMVLIRRGAKGYRDWQKRQKKKSACCEGCESKRERVGVHEKARDHDGENKFRTFVDAEERAARLGCEGAHRTSDGMWGPCATAEEYNSIKGSAGFRRMMIDTPTMAKRRRRRVLSKPQRGEWQTLIERGPLGIETIPGGGLVSGKGLRRRRRRVGRLLGGIGRGFRRVPKVVPYNHHAVDGDGDGIVQEGTIWQRSAGMSFDVPHGTRRRPLGLKPTGERSGGGSTGRVELTSRQREDLQDAIGLRGVVHDDGLVVWDEESMEELELSTHEGMLRYSIESRLDLFEEEMDDPYHGNEARNNHRRLLTIVRRLGLEGSPIMQQAVNWQDEMVKREFVRHDLEELRRTRPMISPARRKQIAEHMGEGFEGILSRYLGDSPERRDGRLALIRSLRDVGAGDDDIFANALERWFVTYGDEGVWAGATQAARQGARTGIVSEILFDHENGMGNIPDVIDREFETLVEEVYNEEKMRNAVAAVGRKNFALVDGMVLGGSPGEAVIGRNMLAGEAGRATGVGEISLQAFAGQALFGTTTLGWYNVGDGIDSTVRHEFGHHVDGVMRHADNRLNYMWNSLWFLMRIRAYRTAEKSEEFSPLLALRVLRREIDPDEVQGDVVGLLLRSAEASGIETMEEAGPLFGGLMPSMYAFIIPEELFAELFALTTSRDFDTMLHARSAWREPLRFMETLHAHLAAGRGFDTLMDELENQGLTQERIIDKIEAVKAEVGI